MRSAVPPAAEHATTAFDPESASIVIVTFNRPALLRRLLESITEMSPKPGCVVIVDNASADATQEVVASFRDRIGVRLLYRRLDKNTGGAGGFSEGMRIAYEIGSEWFWLMDDDVEVVSDGLARLGSWGSRFKVIHGRRYDHDGSEHYWQYRVVEALCIPRLLPSPGFGGADHRPTNSGCFEGMFIHRDIVRKIGLPDPRFFIYWDDHLYGWLASRLTDAAFVDEFVLKRTREIKQRDMGVHVSASSDLSRYYVMRNRAIIKKYYQSLGVYMAAPFALGTSLTLAKELIRLVLVERTLRGAVNLFRGLRDGREVSRDESWEPMPPLDITPTRT